MDFTSKELLFGLCGICVMLAGYLANELVQTLKGIRNSVEELNIKIAIVVERTNNHEARLERLEGKQ